MARKNTRARSTWPSVSSRYHRSAKQCLLNVNQLETAFKSRNCNPTMLERYGAPCQKKPPSSTFLTRTSSIHHHSIMICEIPRLSIQLQKRILQTTDTKLHSHHIRLRKNKVLAVVLNDVPHHLPHGRLLAKNAGNIFHGHPQTQPGT